LGRRGWPALAGGGSGRPLKNRQRAEAAEASTDAGGRAATLRRVALQWAEEAGGSVERSDPTWGILDGSESRGDASMGGGRRAWWAGRRLDVSGGGSGAEGGGGAEGGNGSFILNFL
jgi:hypothetical protein